MKTQKLKTDISELLLLAGISVNGNNPWDIKVYNKKFYSRALADGSLSIGEAEVEEWWNCLQLDEFFSRVLNANLKDSIKANWRIQTDILLTKIFNRQTRALAFHNGQKHYDLGNDFFKHMPDKRMVYTYGYWNDAATLDEAKF